MASYTVLQQIVAGDPSGEFVTVYAPAGSSVSNVAWANWLGCSSPPTINTSGVIDLDPNANAEDIAQLTACGAIAA
jgi:hypothetical protein